MKRFKRMRAFCLAAGLVLTGCGGEQLQASQVDGDTLLIYTSFSTLADFTRQIAGERAEVVNLMPTGSDPHDWEPTPQDIAAMQEMDLLVLNGLGFEHWTDSVLGSSVNPSATVVTTDAIIPLTAEGETHEHDHEDECSHDGVDPHVWTDPNNAGAQMEAIAKALIAIDPEGEAVYRENLAAMQAECAKLDEEYRITIDALPGREIIVAHAAFGYLCARYGLEQVAVQGLAPEGEPDPARMAEIVDYAKEHEVKVIFFESQASPKVAGAIAEEVGAQTAILNSLESLTEEEIAAGEDYFSIMRENLEQLKVALA